MVRNPGAARSYTCGASRQSGRLLRRWHRQLRRRPAATASPSASLPRAQEARGCSHQWSRRARTRAACPAGASCFAARPRRRRTGGGGATARATAARSIDLLKGGRCHFGCGGQDYSWFSIGGGSSGVSHSSDSWFGSPTQFTTDGFMKFLSSKYGWHYTGTQSNAQQNRVQFNETNGNAIAYFNQISAYGEDVMMAGQDWGYMTGNYDGNQNNKCDKTTYNNNVQTRMTAATRNKGHYGASSGCASSAAATVASSGRPGV